MNRRQIVRTCKKHGFHVQPQALHAIQESNISGESEFLDLLQVLQQQTRKMPISNKVLTADLWRTVVDSVRASSANNKNGVEGSDEEELGRSNGKTATALFLPKHSNPATGDKEESPFQVISAFRTPILTYDTLRQQFSYQQSSSKGQLLGTAQDKIDMMTQRYALMQQRVLRHDLFKKSNSSNNKDKLYLTSIDRLLGSSSSSSSNQNSSESMVLLGMLRSHPTDNVTNHYPLWLEDLTGHVALDLSQAQPADPHHTSGYYTEQSMVLVEGFVRDDGAAFMVQKIGFPPLEARSKSELVAPIPRKRGALQDLPPMDVVCFSNCQMDDPQVVSHIQTVLDDIDGQQTPCCIVLMGPFGVNGLDELGMMIETTCPYLEDHAQWIIVPSPADAVGVTCLPQPALTKPASLQSIPKLTMASNPCRIQYGASEVVLFRQALSSIYPHQEILSLKTNSRHNADPSARLAKSMLEQGHLIPFANASPQTAPIYWNLDAALRL